MTKEGYVIKPTVIKNLKTVRTTKQFRTSKALQPCLQVESSHWSQVHWQSSNFAGPQVGVSSMDQGSVLAVRVFGVVATLHYNQKLSQLIMVQNKIN